MDKLQQLPRLTVLWLIAAAFTGIVVHLFYLPIWVGVVSIACLFWRYQVTQGKWKLPGKWLRFLLVSSAVAGVILQYGTLLGPSAGTALLILGYAFKLLETQQRRDAFLVVILGFVVIAAIFFFEQSMLITAYVLLAIWVLVAAMVSLNQHSANHPKQSFSLAGKMLLQTIPLMLVLFLLVPRIAPIWSLNLSESRAKTGLSDQVSVGDIASLSQSDEIAFRAVFTGAQPSKETLYWRALVLDQYDGATWSRGSFAMDESPMVSFQGPGRGWHQQVTPLSTPIRYQIMMEATDQPWLFSLAGLTGFDQNHGYSLDHRLLHATPVSQPIAYNLQSALEYQLDTQIPAWMTEKNRQLPESGDEQTRQLAAQLWSISTGVEDYVRRVLNYFATQGYSYTLRPGQLLTVDKVDEFLFQRQQGFCSHYAGAFVYLMRAAGIPARMVAGYQGGEYSQLGNYWLVHQFDAHAWAEVWIKGKGWIRFDPTAVIAPDRINQGIEDAVAGEQSFLEDSPLSAARYRHLAWVAQLRYSLDYLNYAWYRTVLGYDAKMQLQFLSRLLGEINLQKMALWLLASVAILLLVLGLIIVGRGAKQPVDPLLAEYQRFCRKMSSKGYPRQPQESPEAYALRLQSLLPDNKSELQQISRVFQRHYYSGQSYATPSANSSKPIQDKSVVVLRRLVASL